MIGGEANVELGDLMNAVAEGRVTGDESSRLNALLVADESARAMYLDYMAVDAMLRWMRTDADADAAACVRPAGPRLRLTAARAVGAIAASLLVSVSVWAMWTTGGEPASQVKPKPLAAPVAVLTDAAGLIAGVEADGEVMLVSGQPLRPGLINVSQGTAEIAFGDGATARVQGPARLTLISRGRARLDYGRLAAYVPPTAHGFTVEVGDYKVVDLGTSFAVFAPGDGEMRLHVFDGRVSVQSDAEQRIIEAGGAIGTSAGSLSELPLDRGEFGGLMLALSEVDEHRPPVTEGLALWLSADRGLELAKDGRVAGWRSTTEPIAHEARQTMLERRPTWLASGIAGRPVLRFDGDDFMQLPTTSALGVVESDHEVFIVAQTDQPGVQFLLAGSYGVGTEQFELHLNGDSGLRFIPRHHAERPDGTPIPASYADIASPGAFVGGAHLFEARVVDGVGVAAADAVDGIDTVGDARSLYRGELTLGMRGNASMGLVGDIAEVLIYRRALNDAERAAVRDYLTEKYNLPAPSQRGEGSADERKPEAIE